MNRLTVLLWRARSWIAGAIVPRRTVESRGLRFTLQCDNWITYYRWQTYNTKEPESLDWVDRWVNPGDTVFDVGANIGVYTIYAALKHPSVKVVAFEPEYANLHMLRDNVILNRLQERVEIYSVALGRDSGPTRLYVQDFTPGAALHSVSNQALDCTHTQRPVVGCEGIWSVTLDSFCEQTGMVPAAVKIDVDGTEQEILEGGRRTLASPALRSVIIEMSSDPRIHANCRKLLEDAGFSRGWCSRESPNEVWVKKP